MSTVVRRPASRPGDAYEKAHRVSGRGMLLGCLNRRTLPVRECVAVRLGGRNLRVKVYQLARNFRGSAATRSARRRGALPDDEARVQVDPAEREVRLVAQT